MRKRSVFNENEQTFERFCTVIIFQTRIKKIKQKFISKYINKVIIKKIWPELIPDVGDRVPFLETELQIFYFLLIVRVHFKDPNQV